MTDIEKPAGNPAASGLPLSAGREMKKRPSVSESSAPSKADSIIVRHAPHWRETLAANLSDYRVEGGPTAPSTRGLRRAYDAMLRRAKKRHAKRGARHD